MWHSTASRSAKQQSQCEISRLAGNTSAGDDNISQEVDLNAFDDDKEEEVFGYTHLHASVYFHKMDHLIRGGMMYVNISRSFRAKI